MMANSPLEIYAAVIGARLYNDTFNILVSFSLVYIPLIAIFFRGLSVYFENEFGTGSSASMKQTLWHLVGFILVLLFAIVPTTKLNVKNIAYRPSCMPTASKSVFGDTGTTYDEVFSNIQYNNIRIPYLMSLVMQGASGFTNALITSIPCKTDVQRMQNIIDTTHLTRELNEEVADFNNQCYVQAITKFDSQKPELSKYEATMKAYGGESDLSWIGSHVFQKLYYQDIFAVKPVKPFPYAMYKDYYEDSKKAAGISNPKWGYPSCYDWWSDSSYGLQARLVELIQDKAPDNRHQGHISMTSEMRAWLAKVKNYTNIGSQVSPDDVMVKSLLYDVDSDGGYGGNYSGWMNSSLSSSQSDLQSMTVNGASSLLGTAGQAVNAGFSAIKRTEIDQEIPILQAVILCLVLALGPIILLMGQYSIGVIVSYYFIIFSIIFMPFLEALIHYMELSMHESMSLGLYAASNYAILYNVFTKLYLAVPFIYLMLVSVSGVNVAHAVQGSFADPQSGKGAAVGEKIVSVGIKAAKGGT